MSAAAKPAPVVAVVALVAALIGGQALADASVPAVERQNAGAPVGRAGFAYVTGLRRFAAIALFNRLEPQFHDYYGGKGVDELVFLMPNFRIITWLDPQFVQPYYMATWILYRNGRQSEAFALAAESVKASPRSGLLHTAYAQLLYLATSDVAEQVRQCDAAMRDDTVWASGNEQWESVMVIKDIYAKAGRPEKAERASAVARQIEIDLGGAPGFRDPDEQF